jgi:hypothetical protein
MSNSSGWAVGRLGGLKRCMLIGVLFLTAHPPTRLSAQVGYEPSRSPFRDIAGAQQLGLVVGRFSGAAGYAGVGAQPGTAFGIRFRNRLSGPLELTINASHISTERLFLDPTRPDSTRNRGMVDFSMISADIGLSLSLTGQKSWHGLAPWIGIGIGLITPTSPTTDPGGFKASAGFTLVPAVGTRLFLSQQLALQLEFRDNTIRYEYPLAYFNPTDPTTGATLPPPIIPITRTNKQLTHNFTLSVGASYHFTF